MINHSKIVLLWGLKILSERYWSTPFSPQLDEQVIKSIVGKMPGSEELFAKLTTGYQEPDDAPLYALESIFHRINLFPDTAFDADGKWYLQPSFTLDRLQLPVAEKTIPRKVFADENFDPSKFSMESDAQLLLNALQKYGAFVPIHNSPDCAMPLFDYIRIAAALATRSEGSFRLVVGDLSGIQDFIYTIDSKRALKILRARSFYLELFLNGYAQEICRDFKVCGANILSCGGGNFLLLLPESDDGTFVHQLEQHENRVNKHFLKQFEGRLRMILTSIELTAPDLAESQKNVIQQKWGTLFESLIPKAKAQPFQSEIEKAGVPEEVGGHQCIICKKDAAKSELIKDKEENRLICQFCKVLGTAGTEMRSQNKIQMPPMADIPPDDALSSNPSWPLNDKNGANTGSRSWQVNRVHLNTDPVLLYANYSVDAEGNKRQVADFSEMTRNAIGANRLGTLVMDVDNMGHVFRGGIACKDQREMLISNIALSRMLDYFFKPGLNWLCENPEMRLLKENHPTPEAARNLAVVYSGGDDLLLAGAWDDVAEVAIDIHTAFSAFTCGNSDLGISGALYVATANFPFYIAVQKAQYAEKHFAKAHYEMVEDDQVARYEKCELFVPARDGKKACIKRKNSMTFFYDELTGFQALHEKNTDMKLRYLTALKWSDVHKNLLPYLEQFLEDTLYEMEGQQVKLEYSRGFIGKLFEMHQKYLNEPEGEIYLPDLVYHFARLEPSQNKMLQDIFETFQHYEDKNPQNAIRYLPVLLTWLELLIREKGGKDEDL